MPWFEAESYETSLCTLHAPFASLGFWLLGVGVRDLSSDCWLKLGHKKGFAVVAAGELRITIEVVILNSPTAAAESLFL
jgi:hypothetical protein